MLNVLILHICWLRNKNLLGSRILQKQDINTILAQTDQGYTASIWKGSEWQQKQKHLHTFERALVFIKKKEPKYTLAFILLACFQQWHYFLGVDHITYFSNPNPLPCIVFFLQSKFSEGGNLNTIWIMWKLIESHLLQYKNTEVKCIIEAYLFHQHWNIFHQILHLYWQA